MRTPASPGPDRCNEHCGSTLSADSLGSIGAKRISAQLFHGDSEVRSDFNMLTHANCVVDERQIPAFAQVRSLDERRLL